MIFINLHYHFIKHRILTNHTFPNPAPIIFPDFTPEPRGFCPLSCDMSDQEMYFYLFFHLNIPIIIYLLILTTILIIKWTKINPNFYISGIWLIEFQGQVVAWGKLTCSQENSYIQSLFVAHALRKRGLGSALVKRLIQEATLPLYVNSLPKRVSFYTRLGFVPRRAKLSYGGLIPLVYNNELGRP